MSKLRIENVGPIKKAILDLNKINVIMGPQSSGKSTIAKIVSYCNWAEKRFILDGEYEYDFKEQFMEFHRVSDVYFSADSFIEYESESVKLTYKGNLFKQEIQRIGDELNPSFLNSKNIYIPAERNFVSAIPDLGKYKRTNDNIMNFLYDWYEVKKKYTNENKFPILDLNVSYYHKLERDSDLLVLHEGGKELLLQYGSSGLQSILPLLVLVDYLTNRLYTEKVTESVNEKEEINKVVGFFIKDFMKKIESDEKRYTLLSNIATDKLPFTKNELDELYQRVETRLNQSKYHFSSIIIEEPEQNLFPKTQRDLIYHLLNLINSKERDHRLLITTHSPFVLNAINNCLMGYLVKDSMPQEEIEELKSSDSWINPKLVSIWEIKENEGVLRRIQDEKTDTVSANYFNGIMNEVMDEYYDMLNYLKA